MEHFQSVFRMIWQALQSFSLIYKQFQLLLKRTEYLSDSSGPANL